MSAAGLRTVRAEWTKFCTIPSNLPTLLTALGLMVGLGALTARGAAENFLDRAAGASANSVEAFDATYASMYGGFLFAQITVGALGVLVMTSEYATGTIRASLTAVPRRGRLLAAKVGMYGALALVAGLVASVGAFFVGQVVIGSRGAPTATLDQPGVARAVVGMGLIWALVGLVGVALGCLLRSTMSATTVLVVVDFIVPVIGPRLLPEAVGAWVTTYWPISAGLQITTTVQEPGRLTPWTGLAIMTVFTAVLLTAAFGVFRSRDA